jgi:hypothetical protein
MQEIRVAFVMRDWRRWTGIVATAVALASIMAVVLLLGSPGRSQAGEPRTLDISPPSGLPGASVSVTGGGGWISSINPPYDIFWETKGGAVLGTFAPTGDGSWDEEITIPGSATPGPHQIVACEGAGGDFQACVSESFTVLPPPRTLDISPPSGLPGASVSVAGEIGRASCRERA